MPLERYGVLRGTAIAAVREDDAVDATPHFQVHVVSRGEHRRVAVNIKSQAAPSELLFLVDDDFRHPITAGLPALPAGFTPLPRQPGGLALDYIRGNLFDRRAMRPLPPNLPGTDNDLSDRLEHVIGRAIHESGAEVFAFGEPWGPVAHGEDKVFHFRPDAGIHDAHMNQGSLGRFAGDNGVWQDGGLLVHFPTLDQWVALFLAFQSQAWHTDDQTGAPITTVPDLGPGHRPSPSEPDFRVRIVGALVNPVGPAPERETVTLLNASPVEVDLTGWAIADKQKSKHRLSGRLAAGATRVVTLSPGVALGNRGGIITLLDEAGLKVDGVSYTAAQAEREGWTIVF